MNQGALHPQSLIYRVDRQTDRHRQTDKC